MRFTSPTPSPWRFSAPHADGAAVSSRATNTVVVGSAICSTVIWKQNSRGVSASSVALSSATSARTSSCSGVSTAIAIAIGGYSTTFGTRKKFSSVAGALATMSAALLPSVTMSWRFFIAIGVTEVIGSTPATSTSFSCSTKPRMAFSSPVSARPPRR